MLADRQQIEIAARVLRDGRLVAFPTETVYGLGANALEPAAVLRIFAVKGRPSTIPLIVHVPSINMARQLASRWPAAAEELATRYWPGPLTIVVPRHRNVPDEVTAGLQTIGLRMPAHPVAQALLTEAGIPIAAPSANKFTRLSPTRAEHVRASFTVDEVPIVLDGGPCDVGIESTVVSVVDGTPVVLRPGMVTLPGVEVSANAREGAAHPAPGMSEKHYSPRTPVMLVSSAADVPAGPGGYLWWRTPGSAPRQVRMPADPDAYAATLYGTLHDLDGMGLSWIAIERVPDTPEWLGIADRLERAAR